MFKDDIREYTEKALAKRTVEVVVGEAVASVAPTRVTLKSGTVLEAHTLVWGAGLQGNALVRALGLELERGNRIGVGPDLTIPGYPEVYALGDIAAITDAKTEQVLPQLGSVALQSGEHAGETIVRRRTMSLHANAASRHAGTDSTIPSSSIALGPSRSPSAPTQSTEAGRGRASIRRRSDRASSR